MKTRCRRKCPTAPRARRLVVGGARDAAERAAETAAAAALRGDRAPVTPVSAGRLRRADGAGGPGPASAHATRAVRGLGAGRPLDASARNYFEGRYGRDLSGVRLHTGPAADRATRAVDAAAFTHGQTVALGREGHDPATLAHELAHAAQNRPVLRRKLRVVDPGDQIPRPGGKGVKQTNAQTIEQYLDRLCIFGLPSVKGSGEVTVHDATCSLFAGMFGTACDCLCQMIGSSFDWRIEIRDHGDPDVNFPHTLPDDHKESRVGGKGSGGHVVVPSPNDRIEYGGADKTGKVRTFENWEILAHELCGHARLNDAGAHPKEEPDKRIRHGHETVVPMTNKIRQEIAPHLTERAHTIQAPYCGESFSRLKGAKKWDPSSNIGKCKHLRDLYLKRMRKKHPKDKRFRRKYKLSDRLP